MKQKKSPNSRSKKSKQAQFGAIQLHAFSNRFKSSWNWLTLQISKRPLGSFLFALALLVVLAAVGSVWRKPAPQTETPEKAPISVRVLSVGTQPVVSIPATVQTSGVVKLTAQSGGIVQKVTVTPGQQVKRGQQLTSLGLGYTGGSPQYFQRQIAEKSFTNSKENLPTQLDMIAKRRDIARDAETQAAELREIGRKSLDDTRTLLSLNEQILSVIDDQLKAAEASGNQADIQTYRSAKAGALSGINALRSGLRQAEYQTDDQAEPADIARTSRDLTLQQLDLEERGAKLAVEIAELNYKLARFSESLLYPASPCAGTVERVYVRFGQSVQPGAAIAEVVCAQTGIQAIGLTNQATARKVLQTELGVFRSVDGATASAQILAVSTQATDGPLFSVTAVLSDDKAALTDASYGVLELPVVGDTTSSSIPFVPLDAIYQTQTQSFIYVVTEHEGKLIAAVREVELGVVYGTSVEVLSGLAAGDQVILSRSVAAGDILQVSE